MLLAVIGCSARVVQMTRKIPDSPCANHYAVEPIYAERYDYDAHGNMTRMPHLTAMEWDFKDQLHVTQQQVVNDGVGERTYYVYDAAGQRVRKVTERAALNGSDPRKKEERIYFAGFEVYRKFDGNAVTWSGRRCTSWTINSASRWWRQKQSMTNPQSLIPKSCFDISSATISALRVWNWMRWGRSFPTRNVFLMAARRIRRCGAAWRRARNDTATRVRSGMKRAG